MKSSKKRYPVGDFLKINWRVCWYSVLIWLLAIATGGFVILPWYFLVLPFVVFMVTLLYFRDKKRINAQIAAKYPSYIFAQGLWIGFIWFAFMLSLDLLERLDSFNPYVFVSDPRIFIKFPVVILIPVVYSLWLENKFASKGKTKIHFWLFRHI